jgi:hypothetical protein
MSFSPRDPLHLAWCFIDRRLAGTCNAAVISSAVRRSSNGASWKYFIALPSPESELLTTSPAFSSLSRCMYSSGREMPSLRASSLTCTRPSASAAMTRSRCGFATAVSTASSCSSVAGMDSQAFLHL